MRSTLIRPTTTRKAAAALFAASALTLTACGGTAGEEAGADVEDVVEDDTIAEDDAAAEEDPVEPYDGAYDSDFYGEVDSYVGEQVVLSADVNEVLSTSAFTIAGTDDTAVEPLLVVGATETPTELTPETTVEVSGTVMESFTVTDVEEEMGVDLEDALFEEYEDQRYVMADSVEVLEEVDQG